ncbi:hypothetical protein FGO68_gene8306 [Halteria grandinella]|uniref:Thioesterase domain-containing protein n=1 Tax=Halteria grandinella TaxID=5974 RepID=A0A8J8NIQ6_HALGN|nr:hypothetical protein FGO68_gene8306 [Halteria grandinella]
MQKGQVQYDVETVKRDILSFLKLHEDAYKNGKSVWDTLLSQYVTLDKVEVCVGHPGNVSFRVRIPHEMRNLYQVSMHAGAVCTLVDYCSGAAVTGFDAQNQHISVKLQQDYLSRVMMDREYIVSVIVQKVGKKLAFSQTFIIDALTQEIVVSASHTIAVVKETYKL